MRTLLSLILLLTSVYVSAQFSNAPVAVEDNGIGIYYTHEGRTEKIIPIKFSKMKAGAGRFVSSMTYGLTKIKNKYEYKGRRSPNVVYVGDTFRFVFVDSKPKEKKAPISPYDVSGIVEMIDDYMPKGDISETYLFGPGKTIRDFSAVRFDDKGNRRELTGMEFSVLTSVNTGVDETDEVQFDVKVIDTGVYEVMITRAHPGEYAFVFSENGNGVYQNVYDFSIPEDDRGRAVKKEGYVYDSPYLRGKKAPVENDEDDEDETEQEIKKPELFNR